jgi:hypothetical protein
VILQINKKKEFPSAELGAKFRADLRANLFKPQYLAYIDSTTG